MLMPERVVLDKLPSVSAAQRADTNASLTLLRPETKVFISPMRIGVAPTEAITLEYCGPVSAPLE